MGEKIDAKGSIFKRLGSLEDTCKTPGGDRNRGGVTRKRGEGDTNSIRQKGR